MPRIFFVGCCSGSSADGSGSSGEVIANPCISVDGSSPATIQVTVTSLAGTDATIVADSPLTMTPETSTTYSTGDLGGGLHVKIECLGTGRWRYYRIVEDGDGLPDELIELTGGLAHSPVGASGTDGTRSIVVSA